MCLPTVRVPSRGALTGVDIRRQPSALERWPALCSPEHVEHGLPSHRVFFVKITVICHLPTGRPQAMFIPLQLGHRRRVSGGCLSGLLRGFPCLFLFSFQHGDRCPGMPAQFYRITFFMRPNTEIQTLKLTCRFKRILRKPFCWTQHLEEPVPRSLPFTCSLTPSHCS